MTPERLDAIRADVADAEKRAGRIAMWRAMPHRLAVESGLRTQGLRAPRLAAHLRDLLAEVGRLQAEVERLRPRPSFCLDCLYDLPDGSEFCPECGARLPEERSDNHHDRFRAGQEAMRNVQAPPPQPQAIEPASPPQNVHRPVPSALRVSVLDLAQRAVEGASIRATMRAILALEVER